MHGGFFISQAPRHYRNFTCYIPRTRATRVSNTVEFYPTHCDLPLNDSLDIISLILSELKQLLGEKKNTHFCSNPTALQRAITSLESLFSKCNARQKPLSTSKGDGPRASTRKSTSVYENGTIVKKRFNKGWYKGEVTKYDPIEKYYTILYTDGDTEEFTQDEFKRFRKPKQHYSAQPQKTVQLTN